MLPLWTHFFNKMILKNVKIDEKVENGKVTARTYNPIKWDSEEGVVAFLMSCFLIMICIAGFVMVF